jgi:hypothetical protein
MKHLTFLFLLCFFVGFSSQQASGQTNTPEKIKILFVGNSLTEYNDLPTKVARMGSPDGRKIEVQSLTYANYSLDEHLSNNKLQLLISNGKYDFVVIQQGPSTGNTGKAALIKDGKRISKMCNKAGSKLAFLWCGLQRIISDFLTMSSSRIVRLRSRPMHCCVRLDKCGKITSIPKMIIAIMVTMVSTLLSEGVK